MKKRKPAKCLTPELSLLFKLGSIAIHAEKMMAADGHPFDRIELQQRLADREVQDWIAAMNELALLPVKR